MSLSRAQGDGRMPLSFSAMNLMSITRVAQRSFPFLHYCTVLTCGFTYFCWTAVYCSRCKTITCNSPLTLTANSIFLNKLGKSKALFTLICYHITINVLSHTSLNTHTSLTHIIYNNMQNKYKTYNAYGRPEWQISSKCHIHILKYWH